MVGELIKNTLAEEGEYKPVTGSEIGSLILIDRSKYVYYITFIPVNIITIITAPFSNMRTLKFQSSTDKCIFRYHQSNVWRLLPASDYVV